MKRLLIIFMLLLPAVTHAQKDRTISDLLYFPFSCISDPMTTKDQRPLTSPLPTHNWRYRLFRHPANAGPSTSWPRS